jgi:hypothetical protein
MAEGEVLLDVRAPDVEALWLVEPGLVALRDMDISLPCAGERCLIAVENDQTHRLVELLKDARQGDEASVRATN